MGLGLGLGFGLGGKYEAKIVEKMADTCANIASGELLQHEHVGNLATTPEDYYSIIDGKTAGPFATACACAAIVAGASEDTINALEEFGWEVGRAFQLVDDLLDLIGDENMGKPRGGDVHEGKMTLPIIHALTMLHGVEREQLADVLKNFSDYWTEKSPRGSKMRFEKEKVFDVSRRLATWSRNNFNKTNQPTQADDHLTQHIKNQLKK